MKRLAHVALGLLVACVALAAPAPADPVSIPATSVLYRLKLEHEVAAHFGDLRPAARIAAQVHQESRWNPAAASRFAQGLTQFTPATAQWIPSVCPNLGPPDVWDPNWSMRAAVCYDRWLYRRVSDTASECDRWAMTLSGYNGGLGWVQRDRRRAAFAGADASAWFDQVELHSARAGWAMRENRGYVRRILHTVEPAYLAAGWPGEPVCPT
jgi:membrane-bound lytic murein transglycosylase MltF